MVQAIGFWYGPELSARILNERASARARSSAISRLL